MRVRRSAVLLVLCLLLPGRAWAAGAHFVTDVTVEGALNSCAATGGATNTYACNINPALTAYLPRNCYSFTADVGNTGPASINFNSVGPIAIKKRIAGATQDITTGDIGTNQVVQVCYDGTFMQMTTSGTSIAPVVITLNAASATPTPPDVGTAGARIIAERLDINGALTLPVPTGTPKNGQILVYRLKPATTQQAVAFTGGAGGHCAVAGQVMPTQTGNATTYAEYGFEFNSAIAPAPGCWVFMGGTPATAPLDRAYGGTGQALADPNANSVWVWDDTLNQVRQATLTGLTYTSATNTLAAGAASGVFSFYIPVNDVEGACALGTSAALVTNGPKVTTVTCTDANTDGISFDTVMPDGWNFGTITVELAAFSIGNNSGEVLSLNFSGQCVRDTDSVAAWAITSGATLTSATNVATTITWGAAANREQHATSAPLTLAGTCAAGAHIYLHGLVNATATTVTPMTDVKILGVKVEYTRVSND